ncbi:MAG: hypothetical protein Q9216_003333 [Gyalolechia sp. 2 TL-2023]
MAGSQLEPFLKATTGRNTRGLLRLIILCTIAGAAVASRLFSVIRFESIIHEFDPWFNFRATKYLVQHGFYDFWDWFDDRTWHPLGRVTGGTLYPGLMVTSGIIYHALRLLSMPVDIRNICVLLAPAFSGLTAFASYLITSEMSTSPSAGLLAAVFMGITPGYISRSVAGSYDNEAIAIFLLVFTFFLWIKSIKNGSAMWAALTALFYGYMVSAWGGYVFITNLLPLHAFVLICMGRYSPRLYVSYSTWFALGTLASMQIPFVGFLPVRSSEHMSALGVFGLLQLVAFVDFIRQQVPNRQFQTLLRSLVLLVFLVSVGGLVLLTVSGVIAPWSGRFYSLWDTGYAKIHIPIIASVSEHQPTAWPAFFFDLNLLIWLFPAGVYMCFQHLKDEHVFVVIYAVLSSYFAGVMVRLMLTLTPVVCIAAALALSNILDTYLVAAKPSEDAHANGHPTGGGAGSAIAVMQDSLRSSRGPVKGIYSYVSKASVISSVTTYLLLFVLHCTWVTSNAYSSPSVVLASRLPDGSQHIIDDYREAYYWLRQNTPEKAKVMSWWDYGYQIGGMADRPTLVDNNTWNNTHIATVGKAMSSREEVSYPILRQHDVDYVLVVFGGLLGYSGDDINKFLWMVRIAEGIWPDEVKERDFFTARGEYKVDEGATPTMKNSLMYKMSYYNFNALFPPGQAQDRVRGARMPADGPQLNSLEEAFTSENWIIRIYKVKDLDNVGRDHASAVAFEKGNKKRKNVKRRGPRSSAAPVRTRKPLREREKDREKDKERDKDSRSVASSSTRRHRDTSRSSNRSPLPSSSRPTSLYNQANVTLDQLQPLTRSETASPSSLRSPILRASTAATSSSTPLSASAHLYTPAALQPYLETDDNEDLDNARTPQASATVQNKPYFDADLVHVSSQEEPAKKSPASSPLVLSNPAGKPPSPREPPASPLPLSRVSTRSSDPTPHLQHPRPYHFPASSPAFTQPLPFFGGPPNEQYITPFPPAPQYFPMAQGPNHPLDLQPLPPQNFYQPYNSPPQMHASFNPARSPPAREYSSTGSRMSFSADPPPALGPIPAMPAGSGQPLDTAILGAQKGEEDAVLQRIQSAIPDLHLLLNRYRETSGQLGERELTLRHTEAEKMNLLEQKDAYIERLTKERDEALQRHREENNKHAEEKDKLRLEIGNMTEKHNELHDSLEAERTSRGNVEKTLQSVQGQHAMLMAEHDHWKAQTSRDLEAKDEKLQRKEREYLDQLQRQTHESDAVLRTRDMELAQHHDREKAMLETNWARQRRDLENTQAKLRKDLDEARNSHAKIIEEHLGKHNLEKEAWMQERQSLTKDWQSQLAKMDQGSADIHSHHRKEKDDLQKSWKSTEARLRKEHADSTASLQAEIDRLKIGWDADKAKFAQVSGDLKATASKLNTENSKLQKLADAFEQVTDLRGREDAYYHESFDCLQQQIAAVAEEYCGDCPSQLPHDVAQKIPVDLPSMLDDTPAATRLRLAYVQSLISNVIDRRIFQHFLFTYEHLDDVFNAWGDYLKGKSTKREAFWRQRTLHAAFSCPGSKERINKFARDIIDEIMTAIKPFANKSKRDDMLTAVRKIVKTAAETWRYARIELSRISAYVATDPSKGEEEEEEKEEEGEPLLTIFPRIEREPLPGECRADSQGDTGCVYSTGQILSKKSSAVLARRAELGEIDGLPLAAPPEEEIRLQGKRPRKMSSDMATRVQRFEPRPNSPLIPSMGSAQGSGERTATISDEVQSQMVDGQRGHGTGWRRAVQVGPSEGSMDHQEIRGKEEAEVEAAASQHAYGSAAGSSPLQSPARSRAQSPQLSGRTTASTESLSGDDEKSEMTPKPATPPSWGGGGGNVPGALGVR